MLVKHVIQLCFCSSQVRDGEGGYYWRKPGPPGSGEDLEILEKTWSFFVNLWLTEGKIVISYTLQTLTSYVFLQFSRQTWRRYGEDPPGPPGSGEDPPGPPGSGEDLEILEKTWSSKINIFIAKLSQSPSFQFLISGGCVDTMDPTSFTATHTHTQ